MLWLLNDIFRYVKLLAVFICCGYLPKLYPWISNCLFRVVECLILAVFCRCILQGCFCFPPDTCARAKMAEQSGSALISSEPTESKSNSHDHEHHHHHRTLHQTLLGKGSEAPGRRVLVGVDGSEFSNFALECKCCAGIPAFPSDLCHSGSLSSQSQQQKRKSRLTYITVGHFSHGLQNLSRLASVTVGDFLQSPKPVPSGLCHSGSFSSQSPEPAPADFCYSGSLSS